MKYKYYHLLRQISYFTVAILAQVVLFLGTSHNCFVAIGEMDTGKMPMNYDLRLNQPMYVFFDPLLAPDCIYLPNAMAVDTWDSSVFLYLNYDVPCGVCPGSPEEKKYPVQITTRCILGPSTDVLAKNKKRLVNKSAKGCSKQ